MEERERDLENEKIKGFGVLRGVILKAKLQLGFLGQFDKGKK